MAIGPDGRIIRRHVRQFTPVNTNNPAHNINFFTGFLSLIILSVVILVVAYITGWLGGALINYSWWNGSTFLGFGFILLLIIFPIFISGILEGLYYYKKWLFKLYAFLYGFIFTGILIALYQLGEDTFSYSTYLWAVGYGIYCIGLGSRMAR